MTVQVQYHDQSQSMKYSSVENTYIKGDFFCIKVGDNVYKHPIINIWRVKEDYGKSQ